VDKNERRIAAPTLDLSQFLDALNLNNVVLVGYDWVARAAYKVAALFPQGVATLVAAAAGHATVTPPSEMPHEFLRHHGGQGTLRRGRRELKHDHPRDRQKPFN
jgi:pimeloyl-ACP methyl ester carboxylesterase